MRVDLNTGWASDLDSEYVEVGDRLVARRIQVHLAGAQGQPQADVIIDSSQGRPMCVELMVRASERGPEVRTRDIRLLNIEDVIDAVVPLFTSTEFTRHENGGVSAKIVVPDSDSENYKQARRAIRGVQRAARRVVTDDLLQRVAEAYASDASRPALSVERTLGVSRSTAFRYIREARERGFIKPNGAE